MTNKEKVEALKNGEFWVWPESDYGLAEIWRINNVFVLFGIPTYGGDPWYHSTYSSHEIDEMIEQIKSWT